MKMDDIRGMSYSDETYNEAAWECMLAAGAVDGLHGLADLAYVKNAPRRAGMENEDADETVRRWVALGMPRWSTEGGRA